MKRRLKYFGSTRDKALLGEIINGGTTLIAAGMQVAAADRAAKQQAEALKANAQTQAEMIRQQTENNNALQQQSIDIMKEQLATNKQIQRNAQMNMQLQAGALSSADRREANKIQVKLGGRTKKYKLGNSTSFLRGSNNMNFRVTDGGGVALVNFTPEGYELYEIQGNDHEHYHKAQGGKNKTGVGIKFPNGGVVEGEGNQNTNQGEYMLTTPNDVYFISKHNIAGFNPADAVNAGMHPLQAFNIQEYLKDIKGLNDDGSTTSSPVENDEVARLGRRLKCGGRRKAAAGFSPYWGAAITGGANAIGAGITTIGNNIIAKRLANSYTDAGETIANAYRNMKGIDVSSIDSMFTPAYYMPAVRSSYYNANPQLESINRAERTQRDAIIRNSLSSAAVLNRINRFADQSAAARSQVYADKGNREEEIKQRNIQIINDAAARNVEAQMQANRDYTGTYLNLLQYNNDIANEKLAGIAQARADALTQGAGAKANAMQANAAAWAGTIGAIGQGFGNAYESYRKGREDFGNAALTANYAAMTPEQRAIFDKRADYYGYGNNKKYTLAKVPTYSLKYDTNYRGLGQNLGLNTGFNVNIRNPYIPGRTRLYIR